ncbi:MAG TPA: hypothetical protein VGL20_19020 [Candidatus Dormibacteraeota bacterium]
MNARLMLGAVGLVALLAGCGSGDSGSTPTPGGPVRTPPGLEVGPAKDFGNACRLLSPAEVQSTLGSGPVAASPRSDPQLGSFCTYTPTTGGASVPVLTVQVVIRQSVAAARGDVEQSGGPPLSGVGDSARLSKPGGLGVAVYLSRGATFAVLSSAHKGVTQDELVKLATVLAGRV